MGAHCESEPVVVVVVVVASGIAGEAGACMTPIFYHFHLTGFFFLHVTQCMDVYSSLFQDALV